MYETIPPAFRCHEGGHTEYSKSTGLFGVVQHNSRELLCASPLESCACNLGNIILKVMVS